MMPARMAALAVVVWGAAASLPAPAQAHDNHGATAEDHSAHRAAMAPAAAAAYKLTTAHYEVPDVTLVDGSGVAVRLRELLAQPRPVFLQFIYTTCTTICPVLTATFAQVQGRLASAHADYLMVSVSIDPEYDTPKRLSAYAQRFSADGHWVFLTGKAEDIQASLRAFDALYPSFNKMNHQPATFLKAGEGASWLRFEGFVGADALMKEYAKLGSATTAMTR